jgi:adenosylmethionine-8-amino-7-oxononanoate aminotransferase
MQGVELVKDKKTKEPFLVKHGVAEKLTVALMKHGVIVYPGSGMVDGINGDQFLLAPPLIITKDQVDELVEKMVAGFAAFEKDLAALK